jgi:predicted dehydrogenase
LVTTEAEAKEMSEAVKGVSFMTAFPCRFAPSYQRAKERVRAGDIGTIQAICGTNHGKCPFDWFVDLEQSGGGAMMDHTVHVADLMRDLLQEDPSTVQAQIGSNMYGQSWDDSAMLTLQFPSGVFATVDASWSRPQNYKTWGDVTMNIVGDKGVIELNMFGPQVQVWGESHMVAGYSSNIDNLLVSEWISSLAEKREPAVTLEDGLAASRIAIRAYESARKIEPVAV